MRSWMPCVFSFDSYVNHSASSVDPGASRIVEGSAMHATVLAEGVSLHSTELLFASI